MIPGNSRDTAAMALIGIVVIAAVALTALDRIDAKAMFAILGGAMVIAYRALFGELPPGGKGTGAGPIAGLLVGGVIGDLILRLLR